MDVEKSNDDYTLLYNYSHNDDAQIHSNSVGLVNGNTYSIEIISDGETIETVELTATQPMVDDAPYIVSLECDYFTIYDYCNFDENNDIIEADNAIYAFVEDIDSIKILNMPSVNKTIHRIDRKFLDIDIDREYVDNALFEGLSNKVDRQDGKGLVAVDSEVTFESLNPVTSRAIIRYVDGKIDLSTSDESNNAVSNRVITAYVNDKSASAERNAKNYTDAKRASDLPYSNINSGLSSSNVQDALDEIHNNLINTIKVESWTDVQNIVRLGLAAKVFKVGEQLQCEHEVFGTLTWDIIGIDEDTPINTEHTHCLTLQLHDCLNETFEFDASEPNNTLGSNGYQKWETSNIRQWLNSDGNAESWWTAQSDTDEAPSYADTHDGFLKGLDEDFLSVLGQVSKSTSKPYLAEGKGRDLTSDMMFLLSRTEVHMENNGNLVSNEGNAYSYYRMQVSNTSLGTPQPCRAKSLSYFLRSPILSANGTNGSSVTIIGLNGAYDTSVPTKYANSKLGIAPACCIV